MYIYVLVLIMYSSIYVCINMYVTMHSESSLIRHSVGPENNVGLERMLDYGVPLTIHMYGDCTS